MLVTVSCSRYFFLVASVNPASGFKARTPAVRSPGPAPGHGASRLPQGRAAEQRRSGEGPPAAGTPGGGARGREGRHEASQTLPSPFCRGFSPAGAPAPTDVPKNGVKGSAEQRPPEATPASPRARPLLGAAAAPSCPLHGTPRASPLRPSLPALPRAGNFRFRLSGSGFSGGGGDGGGFLVGGGRGARLERLPVPSLLLRDAAHPAAQPQ